MQGEQSFYGHGMDGGCLRYHNGLFYACFCSGDMNYAYLYTAEHAEGPWNVHRINQEIYGCSILFDDDGRVYIVYGYKNIYLQEMKQDLSDFLEGGLFKKILTSDEPAYVYYNGSHIHKINGRYYISVMNWPKKGSALRTQYCFWSDTIDGEFTGGVAMCTDNGYNYQGVAGGGFVDTPEGDWYSMLFQDRGAVGRMPVLVPVSFKNGVPVFAGGKKFIPEFTVRSTRPDYVYEPVVTSDNFDYAKDDIGRYILKKQWQWNHEPADKLWWINENEAVELGACDISVPNPTSLFYQLVYIANTGAGNHFTIVDEDISTEQIFDLKISQKNFNLLDVTGDGKIDLDDINGLGAYIGHKGAGFDLSRYFETGRYDYDITEFAKIYGTPKDAVLVKDDLSDLVK